MDSGQLDEVLRALAHPDRRAFVEACRDKERAAGDLAELTELAPATVSEHLKVLRKSGLLVLDRRGRFWMYRTNVPLLQGATAELARLARGSGPGGNPAGTSVRTRRVDG